MTTREFNKELIKDFPFQPTLKQEQLFTQVVDFIFSKNKELLFILKGYAGTGKTTVLSTLVKNLWKIKMKGVLLAPTGRAAKVISNYSKRNASTIHRMIYMPKRQKNGGVQFVLQKNRHKNTLFIVDEASMISDISSKNDSY